MDAIGRRLIELTKEKVREGSMLLLLSAPSTMEYYPKIDMKKIANGFIVN